MDWNVIWHVRGLELSNHPVVHRPHDTMLVDLKLVAVPFRHVYVYHKRSMVRGTSVWVRPVKIGHRTTVTDTTF
jgi:hypothetical protein